MVPSLMARMLEVSRYDLASSSIFSLSSRGTARFVYGPQKPCDSKPILATVPNCRNPPSQCFLRRRVAKFPVGLSGDPTLDASLDNPRLGTQYAVASVATSRDSLPQVLRSVSTVIRSYQSLPLTVDFLPAVLPAAISDVAVPDLVGFETSYVFSEDHKYLKSRSVINGDDFSRASGSEDPIHRENPVSN